MASVYGNPLSFSSHEAGFDDTNLDLPAFIDPYANWVRPDGPLRVGLQAGHWLAEQAPEEQINLRKNTGAIGGGTSEVAVNRAIVLAIQPLLEAEGVIVDLLPTTIPPEYWADAFITIHADGNENPTINGYKIAAPRRDRSGQARTLVSTLDKYYATATGLALDPNITSNMRGYYAFNWRRYDHSIHPMTPAAIVETGFITSAKDRAVIVYDQDTVARAIADGILEFLGVDYLPS